MALDFGQTARQMMSAMGDLSTTARSRRQRFADTLDRASAVTPDDAAQRTASAGNRPFIVALTGPEGLLDSIPPSPAPPNWAAISVDGSHIDVDRHLPLRCYLINLGGCVLTYGANPDCQFFSEPTLATGDSDLYLRPDDGSNAETPISGQLLGALRTVREVERLADAVEASSPDLPVLALLDGTLAFWDIQRGNYPRYVVETLVNERLRGALARLRDASRSRRPVALAAYTSRPQTTEVAGAVRACLCLSNPVECTRRCSARRSDLAQCDSAAGFDDRELFDALLEPGHRSPLYQTGRRASHFALDPGGGHRVEPVLLRERRHGNRPRRGARLGRCGPRPARVGPRHAGETVRTRPGLSRGNLGSPRAGRGQRPGPRRVSQAGPDADGAKRAANPRIGQDRLETTALGMNSILLHRYTG